MIVCPDMEKNYPRITHGAGPYIFDEEGKRYLDGSSGSSSVSNLGHGLSEIGEVISEQIGKIAILPTHVFSSAIVEEYLSELVDFAPKGFTRAWTVMSGSEAVENAIKLALQYHQLMGSQRYKIISRWSTYHGNSIFTLDVGGMKFRRQRFIQWMNNFPHIAPAYLYRKPAELSEEEYVQQLADEFESCITREGADTIAAFIAEPVVAAALGAVPPPQGYFEKISSICKKYGILFIVDEVLTGFGRTGKNFGIENFNVVPDIIATGKGISAGYYPLSAIIASEKVMEPFIKKNEAFMGGHTFTCNPVAAAVGKHVLKLIKRDSIVENSRVMGELLKKKLETLYKYDIVGDVRGLGLFCGVEFVMDKVTKAPFPASYNISKLIGEKVIKRGVVLYPGKGSVDGVLGDHVMIVPPLTIKEEQVDEIVNALEESIIEVQNEIAKSAKL